MKKKKPDQNHQRDQNCHWCKDYYNFEMPETIIRALIEGNLVIFAGSGISTEKKGLFLESFYEEICLDLDIDPLETSYSFSDLMTKFEEQPDGRQKLLWKIKNKINYARSYTELFNRATEFHKELSSLYNIKEIVTTNWDDFFETECDAMPIVIPNDFAYWNFPGRKVLKIHGSINNPSTIIANSCDYQRSYKTLTKNTMGSFLKTLLTTKTVVFCGYSMKDEDFNKIYKYLKNELGSVLPHSFIITLDQTIEKRLDQIAITPILTDATFFVHKLKEFLITNSFMISDEIYLEVDLLLLQLEMIHKEISKFDCRKYFNNLFGISYQDGLIHSLDRALRSKKTGMYLDFNYVKRLVNNYRSLRRKKLNHKQYWDVSYIDGYLEGLKYFTKKNAKLRKLRFFKLYGSNKQFDNLDEYFNELILNKTYDEDSAIEAKKIIGKKRGTNTVLHHPAFL